MEIKNPKEQEKPDKWGLIIGITAGFVTICLLRLLLESGLQKPVRVYWVERAGPLETSFCPDIPEGLYFGDTYGTIVEKMGREPDRNSALSPKATIYFYFVKPSTFEFSMVSFSFFNNELYSVMALHYGNSESEEAAKSFKTKQADFQAEFEKIYGQPKISLQEIPNAQTNPAEVRIWEFSHNAILSGPGLMAEDNLLYFATVICPIEKSNYYDFKNY